MYVSKPTIAVGFQSLILWIKLRPLLSVTYVIYFGFTTRKETEKISNVFLMVFLKYKALSKFDLQQNINNFQRVKYRI